MAELSHTVDGDLITEKCTQGFIQHDLIFGEAEIHFLTFAFFFLAGAFGCESCEARARASMILRAWVPEATPGHAPR